MSKSPKQGCVFQHCAVPESVWLASPVCVVRPVCDSATFYAPEWAALTVCRIAD